MGYQLTKKVEDLTPYEPITGDYAIRLDANESFFNLANPADFAPQAQELRAAVVKQIQQSIENSSFNRYPDPFSTKPREAFAARYGVPAKLVTAGNGSDELISLILGGLLEKGTRLVTMSEDFSMYRFGGHLYEHENIIYQKPPSMKIDADHLIGFLRENKAEALVFSNPCNPTSLLLDRAEVLKIVQAMPQMLVVVDEAYMEFCKSQSVMGDVTNFDNLIVLKTCSKALGLAGVRVGFAIACQPLTTALAAIKPPYNISTMAQAVATAVLENGALCAYCTEEIIKARDVLQILLSKVLAGKETIEAIYPSSTNFIWIKTTAAGDILTKLKERGIIIRQMGGFLRISAGKEQENQTLAQALKEIVR